MNYRGLQLRHICFLSHQKESTYLEFKSGLNVICGASDTGKSFIALSIDFMLGAKPPLKDIRERVGYDLILMGMEAHDGSTFTLERSIDGGDFFCYDGLLTDFPDRLNGKHLRKRHNEKKEDNLSRYLLNLIGLDKRRVIKNKHGVKKSLSYRNLARLTIIQEQEIIKEQSPILSGQHTEQTLEYSVFKLLLTGNDDSAFISKEPQGKDKLEVLGRIDLINQLVAEYQDELEELADDPNNLNDQLEHLNESILRHQEALYVTEQQLSNLMSQRREMVSGREKIINRLDEIEGLIARFSLLEKHYNSDIDRLEAIQESGVLFTYLLLLLALFVGHKYTTKLITACVMEM
ncbi:MAG: AAA family ATPase [Candidatus Competibacteraceae bacterium]|nr:AAA family ATPase [Candidatus Competibacteraceae bacterium]